MDGKCLALEEGLRDGGIQYPLGMVHQRVGISASGIVDELSIYLHAEGQVHLWRKVHLIGVSVLVVLRSLAVTGEVTIIHRAERHAPDVLSVSQPDIGTGSVRVNGGKSKAIAHGTNVADVVRIVCIYSCIQVPVACRVQRLVGIS